MLKKKLLCAAIGLGIGLTSLTAIAGQCAIERDQCIASGTSRSVCKMIYLDCLD